jgi:TolB-like protein/DNA-binding winged helix-turn-helix (wHTH) protein/Flp pilus assembly protein TadD
MARAALRPIRIGPYRLDAGARLAFRNGVRVPLRPRVFETLFVLASRAGRLVTKEELLDAVWPDTVVEENNLNQNILALRRALQRNPEDGVRIETVPRRGYRLVVELPPAAALEGESISMVPPAAASGDATAAAFARGIPVPADGPSRRSFPFRFGLVATAALILAAAFWIPPRLRERRRPIAGVRSIAVLPLVSHGDAGESLGFGIADAVITRLGYVRSLSVRPTASMRAFRGPDVDPVEAGRALGVNAVLAGEIQKSGSRVRVTVQLIGTSTGATLWSDKLDVSSSDVFAIEDAISDSVARALTVGLSAGETTHLARQRRTSPEAYRAYLDGRYFWDARTAEAARRARRAFEKAIRLDPEYAPAYAGLADTLNALHEVDDGGDRARQVAERAIALDDTVAEAYAARGNTSLFTDWKVDEAERDFRRALELNPSYATARQWFAYCFLVRGDLAGATREIRLAQQTDPLSRSIGVDVGLLDYFAGRFEDALTEYRRVLSIDPGFQQALQAIPDVLESEGNLPSARQACEAIAAAGDALAAARCQALVAAMAGDPSEAERLREGPSWPAREIWDSKVALALGDCPRAVGDLEEAVARRAADLLLVGADPRYDALRADPSFARLLARIGVRPVGRAAQMRPAPGRSEIAHLSRARL